MGGLTMRSIIIFVIVIFLCIFLLGGCDFTGEDEKKQARIDKIEPEKNYYKPGDKVEVMIEIANDYPISFTPKMGSL